MFKFKSSIINGIPMDGDKPIDPRVRSFFERRGAVITQANGYVTISGPFSFSQSDVDKELPWLKKESKSKYSNINSEDILSRSTDKPAKAIDFDRKPFNSKNLNSNVSSAVDYFLYPVVCLFFVALSALLYKARRRNQLLTAYNLARVQQIDVPQQTNTVTKVEEVSAKQQQSKSITFLAENTQQAEITQASSNNSVVENLTPQPQKRVKSEGEYSGLRKGFLL